MFKSLAAAAFMLGTGSYKLNQMKNSEAQAN